MKNPRKLTPAQPAGAAPRVAPRKKHHFSAEGLAAIRANIRKAHARMRKYGPTARQRAAARANMRKLSASTDPAFKAFKYRRTARRVAANLATIKIAQATPRPRESWNPSRYNALRHGLYVRAFRKTLARVGESPQEFKALEKRVERAFQARGKAEGRAARRLAEALWRRLRLFRAQLRWETDAVNRVLDSGAAVGSRDPDDLRTLGLLLMEVLLNPSPLLQAAHKLVFKVERQIRAFLRLVVGGDPKFRIFTRTLRRRMSLEARLRREIQQSRAILEWGKRLRAGDPVAIRAFEGTVARLEAAHLPVAAVLDL